MCITLFAACGDVKPHMYIDKEMAFNVVVPGKSPTEVVLVKVPCARIRGARCKNKGSSTYLHVCASRQQH